MLWPSSALLFFSNLLKLNYQQSGNPLVLLCGYDYFNVEFDTETRAEDNPDGISEEEILRLLERFDVVNGNFDYEEFLLRSRQLSLDLI